MNRKESLDLFSKGSAVWNEWADAMLAEKEAPAESSRGAADVVEWAKRAKADFSGHVFETSADFGTFRFPGEADFNRTTFRKQVWFRGNTFGGNASFRDASFLDYCGFSSVKIDGLTVFSGATMGGRADFTDVEFLMLANFKDVVLKDEVHFTRSKFGFSVSFLGANISGSAVFWHTDVSHEAYFQNVKFLRRLMVHECIFSGDVTFEQCIFEEPASISRSAFMKNSSFRAVSGKGLFLADINFQRLPDFSGAHFEEAPSFDLVNLNPERLVANAPAESKYGLPAQWRALRRLAIEGHDHERELQFFKGEITARRGTVDTWRTGRFWVGWLYEVLSDFGRSMLRPVVWLMMTFGLFGAFYFGYGHVARQELFTGWLKCIAGEGGTLPAALSLSVHNVFPFAGIGSSGKLEQVYACLYGIHPVTSLEDGGLPVGFTPVIPDGVALAGVAQFIVSAVLVFLFVLAIRNYFRIK